MTIIDPTAMTVTDRQPLKRQREGAGIDRTPFYDLFAKLTVNQVVEIPAALTAKEAKSAANILRESAKDKGLALTFLSDTERNTNLTAADKKAEKQFYAWFIKGDYQPREPKAQNGKK